MERLAAIHPKTTGKPTPKIAPASYKPSKVRRTKNPREPEDDQHRLRKIPQSDAEDGSTAHQQSQGSESNGEPKMSFRPRPPAQFFPPGPIPFSG